MQIAVGVDIVDVRRLRRLLEDNPLGAGGIFTSHELTYCAARRDRYPHLAARFAAKEALLKAFGTGCGRATTGRTSRSATTRSAGRCCTCRAGSPTSSRLAAAPPRCRSRIPATTRSRRFRWCSYPLGHLPSAGRNAMRFHLIDRIDSVDPGRFGTARKLTSRLETFWRRGSRAAMPTPLLLEALCVVALVRQVPAPPPQVVLDVAAADDQHAAFAQRRALRPPGPASGTRTAPAGSRRSRGWCAGVAAQCRTPARPGCKG